MQTTFAINLFTNVWGDDTFKQGGRYNFGYVVAAVTEKWCTGWCYHQSSANSNQKIVPTILGAFLPGIFWTSVQLLQEY